MKRTMLALILAFSILAAAELQLVKSAKANAYVFGMMPRTYIHSPENKTYTTDSVLVDVSFEISQRVYDKSSNPTITIQLDNAGYMMNGWFRIPAEFVIANDTWVIFHGQTTLENLSDGKHEVRFACSASTLGSIYDTVAIFTVEAHPPTVTILSPENKTYETNSLPLNFTVNKAASQIKYSLDGKENVTTAGNDTLTDLPNGQHNATVYAADETGKASETVHFSVEVPEVSEPFPRTLVVAASGASIAGVSAAMLVYWKKRKR